MWCPHLEVPTLRGVVPMDLGCLRQVQEHQAIRYGVRGDLEDEGQESGSGFVWHTATLCPTHGGGKLRGQSGRNLPSIQAGVCVFICRYKEPSAHPVLWEPPPHCLTHPLGIEGTWGRRCHNADPREPSPCPLTPQPHGEQPLRLVCRVEPRQLPAERGLRE